MFILYISQAYISYSLILGTLFFVQGKAVTVTIFSTRGVARNRLRLVTNEPQRAGTRIKCLLTRIGAPSLHPMIVIDDRPHDKNKKSCITNLNGSKSREKSHLNLVWKRSK